MPMLPQRSDHAKARAPMDAKKVGRPAFDQGHGTRACDLAADAMLQA
jgi:hypothetical protein